MGAAKDPAVKTVFDVKLEWVMGVQREMGEEMRVGGSGDLVILGLAFLKAAKRSMARPRVGDETFVVGVSIFRIVGWERVVVGCCDCCCLKGGNDGSNLLELDEAKVVEEEGKIVEDEEEKVEDEE